MFYRGKNVLVAGGAGLVGQSLVRKLLDQGAYVRATQYTTRAISLKPDNLEIVSCDLMDDIQARKVFSDMNVVFLAAARVRGAKELQANPSSLINAIDFFSKI